MTEKWGKIVTENSGNSSFRNKKKDIFVAILKSYARNIATEARRKIMVDDVSENRGRNIDPDTFDSYVEALNDLYIIKDIDAWNPNFRSKTTIVTSPTRHFVDTSLAAYSLSMGPNDLMNDPSTFGLLFEDFAVRDLCIYAGTLGGEVRHYRDGNGLECDAVINSWRKPIGLPMELKPLFFDLNLTYIRYIIYVYNERSNR